MMYSANSTLAGYDSAHSSRLHNFVVHLCVQLRAAVYHTVALGNIKTSSDSISAGLYLILTVSEAVWNKNIIR